MQSKLMQQFFANMLSVTLLLFTIGIVFDERNINYSDAPSNSSVEIDSNEQKVDFNKWPLTQPSTVSISFVPFESSVGESQEQVQTTKQQDKDLLKTEVTDTDVTSANYEVTAYYLNVRANSNVPSKILSVVRNGDILEVLETTDNDWLKIKSGGYVNGKYAKLISGNDKQSAPVTILSVEHTAVVPNKPTSIVKSDSSLTEENISQFFKGTDLADQGLEKTILEIEQEYGINAFFTIAVMKLESGNGKSKIAKNKNNLFGLNAIDSDAYNKAFSFKSKRESIQKFGQLISDKYVDKGYTSVEKVASKYCEANPKWSALVFSIMKSDYEKLQ